MILISACLIGLCCRYDGKVKNIDQVMTFLKDKNYIPICPEQMGGLSTPRQPAEIVSLQPLKIMTDDQHDVTAQFTKGVDEVVKLTDLFEVEMAILKSKSPSCGKYQRYDGTFSRQLIEGPGILADRMMAMGIEVLNEEDL